MREYGEKYKIYIIGDAGITSFVLDKAVQYASIEPKSTFYEQDSVISRA